MFNLEDPRIPCHSNFGSKIDFVLDLKAYCIIQTEAERRRREAGVKQSMEIRVRSCMYVCMYVGGYVWYLELSREPRHVAQQTRYQNVDLGNGHCLGTISSGCDQGGSKSSSYQSGNPKRDVTFGSPEGI